MPRARVLLLGDGLLLSFRDRLARVLSEEGLGIAGPGVSCGDPVALAEGAAGWAEEFEPDLACFGCGPWAAESLVAAISDRRVAEAIEPVSLSTFERSLMEAVRALGRVCGRQVVYFTTPPVHEGRLGMAAGDRDIGHALNGWIAQYNQIAAGLMGELNVAVADLHHELARFDDDALGEDGAGLSAAGVEIAARVVATGIYGVIHP